VSDEREEAEQVGLFGSDEEFHRVWSEWNGMPEFSNDNRRAASSVMVHFASAADRAAFEELLGQKLPLGKRLGSIWYPPEAAFGVVDKRYRVPEEA
jgi:hypothetical protein